jgi:hypothetical protein
MSDVLEFHIACPQCNYSNTATTTTAKYKEVVYQPCIDNQVHAKTFRNTMTNDLYIQ